MIKLRDYCLDDKNFVKEVLNEVQDQYIQVLPGYINGLGRYFDNKELESIGDVRIIEYKGEEVGWLSERKEDKDELYISHFYIRSDFQGNLFPGSLNLLSFADVLVELKTICHCGKKAIMNMRIDPNGRRIDDGEQILIGGNERYVAVCRQHFFSGESGVSVEN